MYVVCVCVCVCMCVGYRRAVQRNQVIVAVVLEVLVIEVGPGAALREVDVSAHTGKWCSNGIATDYVVQSRGRDGVVVSVFGPRERADRAVELRNESMRLPIKFPNRSVHQYPLEAVGTRWHGPPVVI